ncbi:hypothetical protein T492DRAFT_1023528 [Pavlovales sp. CCMP2436]|nr:hypothetical protein T492DRAFT_1023528 [Pavlovales sp. CCMP2436]
MDHSNPPISPPRAQSAPAAFNCAISEPSSTSILSPGVPVKSPPMLSPPMKTWGSEVCPKSSPRDARVAAPSGPSRKNAKPGSTILSFDSSTPAERRTVIASTQNGESR